MEDRPRQCPYFAQHFVSTALSLTTTRLRNSLIFLAMQSSALRISLKEAVSHCRTLSIKSDDGLDFEGIAVLLVKAAMDFGGHHLRMRLLLRSRQLTLIGWPSTLLLSIERGSSKKVK